MSTENSSGSHGITFWEAMQVLFIGLKLAGVIDWPWYVVLAPTLIEVAVLLLVLLIIVWAAINDKL